MFKALLTGSLLLILLQANAQETNNKNKNEGGSIIGTVTDSLSKKTIEYATISLFREGDKKAVNGTVTNKEGQYSSTDIDPAHGKNYEER